MAKLSRILARSYDETIGRIARDYDSEFDPANLQDEANASATICEVIAYVYDLRINQVIRDIKKAIDG